MKFWILLNILHSGGQFRVVGTSCLIDFNILFGHIYDDADKAFNIAAIIDNGGSILGAQ